MFLTLAEWLAWQETLHHATIDLGLNRVREVMQALDLVQPSCPVITISGTKGKGSCAALLASLYSAAGYRVGLFTSPHLQRYNERIRINQQCISDQSLCVAFERINMARRDTSLTYFEFNTLAALLTFSSAMLDVWILEVGMGGRLDAVNVIDADVAIVSSIGLDHTEWLGNDLEAIGREKAGIMRRGQPAVFAAAQMPQSIQTVADEIGARLLRAEKEFGFDDHGSHWSWWSNSGGEKYQMDGLPAPGIAGAVQLWNAAAVLMALNLLSQRLPINRLALEQGLADVRLSGRFQRIVSEKAQDVEWILDVAHNPMSATVLAAHLRHHVNTNGTQGRTITVFGMLSDKDVVGTVNALQSVVDEWIVTGLGGMRALSEHELAMALRRGGLVVQSVAADVGSACSLALARAKPGDRILVCGSFLTVGAALTWLEQ